jgi:hypothetical protein
MSISEAKVTYRLNILPFQPHATALPARPNDYPVFSHPPEATTSSGAEITGRQ